jgi:predicted nucleic acid-binding protein
VSGAARRLVVDASVGVKLFLNEESSDLAQELFEQLLVDDDLEFYVPDLFFIECADVLWKSARARRISTRDALRAAADLQRLALVSLPTREFARPALNIAATLGVTAYDACYLAVAEELRAPLVTADDALCRTARKARHAAYLLADLPKLLAALE